MKKTILFSSAFVALAMLASCQKEEFIETPATATGVTEFTATIEPPTKTIIDASDGKVTWVKGDEITIKDAESKSAVYEAVSAGATTTFTLKPGQTAVGVGPYTATYGDITKQVYDENGANCPLSAGKTTGTSTNLQFSSPYAVLKITAKSSGGETIKTVVVTYGGKGFSLDCGEGVTLTSAGVVFYVAVQVPSKAAAALSVTFYNDSGQMSTKTRTASILLAAKDLLPVTLDSFDWKTPTSTFKAVHNTTDGSLTFYYDNNLHIGEGVLYDKLPDAATTYANWGYNNIRQNIKSVVIDPSVAGYKNLKSTVSMFQAMTNASSISGAEHLDVSNVTNMSYMFQNFGSASTTLTAVPKVSGWNTGSVTDMSNMFQSYGSKNTSFNAVPDVSSWNTDNVKTMKYMFQNYGGLSDSLKVVPNVSSNGSYWNTSSVDNMDSMFKDYGKSSKVLAKAPEVSNWNTGKVTTLSDMFNGYGKTSKKLEEVPNVGGSGWKTDDVTDIDSMFKDYGNGSAKFNLDLSNWDLVGITYATTVFDCIAKEFYVIIPAKTGTKDNDNQNWYFGDGTKLAIKPACISKEGTDSDNWVRWQFNQTKPAN